MTLDSNLVTAQWGLIGAFGVAVTLLAPRAEQYRSDYLQTGEIRDRIRANRWGNLVRRTPMMVLVAVGGLSVLGAQAAGSKWIRVPSETFVLLLVPILAQVGFVYLLIKLVPKLPSVMPGRLTAPLTPYPASRSSVAQTTITFANESNQSLLIWWLDTTGTPFPVGRDGKPNRIPPDRSESLNSYDGHFFLIQTLDGLNVGIAEARESPSIVSISQAALDTALPVSRSVVPSPQRSLLGSAFQKITSILGSRNDHS
jgi:hypothetical protein